MTIDIHIVSIKKLTGRRKKVKIAENAVKLPSMKIDGQLYKVVKSFRRGRYIVEPVKCLILPSLPLAGRRSCSAP